jgi:hypothetical protein
MPHSDKAPRFHAGQTRCAARSHGGPPASDLSPAGTQLVIASNRDAERLLTTNANLWLITLRVV